MANTKGQTRLGLSDEIGKYGATPAAALVCEQIKEKSAAYQMLPDDDTIFVDTTSASVTITLPSVLQAYKGKVYSVVKLVAANSLVLDGFGSDPVESGTGVTATARWERISVVTDGTVWVRAAPGQGGVAPTGVALDDLSNVDAQNLALGDGTSSPALVLSKSDAGTADVSLKSGGNMRGRLRLDASENVVLSVHDAGGLLLGSITMNNSTGRISVSGGLTLSSGTLRAGLTEYVDNAAALAGGLVAGDTYVLAATKALTVVT